MLNKGVVDEIIICENDKELVVIKSPKKRLGAAVGKMEEFPFDLKNEEMNEEIIKDFDLF